MTTADAPLILLVEDNPDDVRLAKRALAKTAVGARVDVARDGAEAIDYLLGPGSGERPAPALVLLDISLPKIDGLEVLKRLREHERTSLLPIVILTSSQAEQDAAESSRLRASGYIRKPEDLSHYTEAMRTLMFNWLGLDSTVGAQAGFAQVSAAEQLLAEVTYQIANAPFEPEAILNAVTMTMSRRRPGTWLTALMSKDQRLVRFIVENDNDPLLARYTRELDFSSDALLNSITMRVIESDTPFLIPSAPHQEFVGMMTRDVREHLQKNPPPVATPARHMGVLVVPMHARGATVGALGVFERDPANPLTEKDVGLLQAVADRTGLAVENAQIYADSVSRLKRLAALRSIGLAIAGSHDLRLTLRVILDQVIAGLAVDAADVLLLDEDDGKLRVVASTGFRSTPMPEYRLPVDDGLPGQAVLRRRIEIVTSPGDFSQFSRRPLFAKEGFRAYAAVPLIVDRKLRGVLEIFNRSILKPDEEWSEFLEALGGDAALALVNAAMSNQLEKLRPPALSVDASAPAVDLSRREKEILGLLVEGHTNRDIAAELHLSENTIKFHVGKILQKFGASNRTELTHMVDRKEQPNR